VPGIIAGSLLVFIPAIGEYVIPALLGGIDSLMIGRTLYDEFFVNGDWPLASAVATILLIIIMIPIMLFQRSQQRQE
jgi:putrescine transport system permease protein